VMCYVAGSFTFCVKCMRIVQMYGNTWGGGGLADRAVNCVCNLCIKLVP